LPDDERSVPAIVLPPTSSCAQAGAAGLAAAARAVADLLLSDIRPATALAACRIDVVGLLSEPWVYAVCRRAIRLQL
jgi:hypothetical protein